MHLVFLAILLCALSLSTAQRTNFVNEDSKLVDFAEKQWYKDNVPFLEVPDEQIEAVYYYRWSSLKRHLRYTLPGAGYIVTEFVHKVGYSQKYDTINAAAGHHIDEARWLRDTTYVKDYINVWAREGAGNQQYSEWIADSSYNAFLVNGDAPFIKSQLHGFIRNFEGWGNRFEPELNLYFLSPHDDAMEHSASSEQTDDPYHGGLGYRPSHNGEMYANALAIANIAKLTGDNATAAEFEEKAQKIRQGMLDHLWDSERKFFFHVFREDNPSLDYLDTREEIGFFPWRWGVPPLGEEEYEAAWEALFDTEGGFNTPFGPTTCEQRSQWYVGNQTSMCCFWNGNSWPYSTGHTLRALAAQVKHYRPTTFADVTTYNQLLKQYARTQYKNGKPYVAECHSPIGDFWVCDARNGSEHYAHSTYNDNVLADLIGIEPQADNTFQVNPLVPPTWSYFIAENIPYHGHNVTVLYDRDGSKYSTGTKGLHIYVNGDLVGLQENVGLMKVDIPPPPISRQGPLPRMENYAANVNALGYPAPEASYTSATDATVWQAVDGRIFYDFIPSNRWSNFGNDVNAKDWFAVNFGPGRKKLVSQVKVFVYSDAETGGNIACPASISVEYYDSASHKWEPVQEQVSTPSVCLANDIWTVDFLPVTTQQLRVVFANNITAGKWVGMTELQILGMWPQSDGYEAEDGLLAPRVGMFSSPSASGGSYVGQVNSLESWVEFPGVWVDQEGDYGVTVTYANTGFADATMNVTVNNFYEYNVTFPRTGGGWEDVNLELGLWRGSNVIIFRYMDSGAINLDKIKVLV